MGWVQAGVLFELPGKMSDAAIVQSNGNIHKGKGSIDQKFFYFFNPLIDDIFFECLMLNKRK